MIKYTFMEQNNGKFRQFLGKVHGSVVGLNDVVWNRSQWRDSITTVRTNKPKFIQNFDKAGLSVITFFMPATTDIYDRETNSIIRRSALDTAILGGILETLKPILTQAYINFATLPKPDALIYLMEASSILLLSIICRNIIYNTLGKNALKVIRPFLKN